MTVATFQLGRLVLREDLTVSLAVDAAGFRTMPLSGQESIPRHTAANVVKQKEDLLDLQGSFLPVTFSRHPYLDGYYGVTDASGDIYDDAGGICLFKWNVNLVRYGNLSEIDIESRLSGAQTRANNFAATGERSHAPALGHNVYWVGLSTPSAVDRPCSDGGSIRLYRTIGTTVNPRWGITPGSYGGGRCRLLDAADRERSGTKFILNPAQPWHVHNGVVSVKPGSGGATFDIGVWDGTSWEYISWLVQSESPYATIATFDYITVLRNEYEITVVRFTKSTSPYGRFSLDLTIRRGSRIAELYLQNEYSTQMRVVRSSASAGTQTSGYVTANASDAAGNRYVVGSAKTFSANTVTGGVEKTATVTLDVMVGSVLNGAGAIAGDTAANLYAQYLGMPAELVRGVRR